MTYKEAQEVFVKYLRTGCVPNPADLYDASEIAIEAIKFIREHKINII